MFVLIRVLILFSFGRIKDILKDCCVYLKVGKINKYKGSFF